MKIAVIQPPYANALSTANPPHNQFTNIPPM